MYITINIVLNFSMYFRYRFFFILCHCLLFYLNVNNKTHKWYSIEFLNFGVCALQTFFHVLLIQNFFYPYYSVGVVMFSCTTCNKQSNNSLLNFSILLPYTCFILKIYAFYKSKPIELRLKVFPF